MSANHVDLHTIDMALMRLRRAWQAPAGIEHEGRRVDGSTLLVCVAVEEAGGVADLGQIAVALQVAQSTASRLVARAAEAAMIARRADPADPRRAAVTLTAAGHRLVAAGQAFRARRLAAALAGWSPAEIATLATVLDRFASAHLDQLIDRRP